MKGNRSHTIDGDQLLPILKKAITEASRQQSICLIKHKNDEAAVISAMWVPLIMKLVNGEFKKSEVRALTKKLKDAKTKKEISHALASWAEELV